MDKYLLLEAAERNRDLMGPGSWNHTEWKIMSNGEYTASIHYNSIAGEWDSNPTIIHESGNMPQSDFEHLVSVIKQKWHVGIQSYGCDGSAWDVRMYSLSGKVIKRWKEGYIYGQPVMEEIAKSLLPLVNEEWEEDEDETEKRADELLREIGGMECDSFFKKELSKAMDELEMMINARETDHRPILKKYISYAKKHIEMILYNFVANGCQDYGCIQGAFPELHTQYDPDSMELLDEKIRILSEIAKQGLECDYRNIDGFNDILEKKLPPGIIETVHF